MPLPKVPVLKLNVPRLNDLKLNVPRLNDLKLNDRELTVRKLGVRKPTAVILALLMLSGCTGWAAPWARPTPAAPSSVVTSSPLAGDRVRVSGVSDGDTFTATRADGERIRVRMLGIDAPEAGTGDDAAQCGADEATRALTRLVGGRHVVLVGDLRADPIDRFGRHLVYVEVDGTDVAGVLVAAGMAAAWYPRGEPQPERFPAYQDAEAAARVAQLGLWATCESIGR